LLLCYTVTGWLTKKGDQLVKTLSLMTTLLFQNKWKKNETEDKLANPSSPEKWPLKLGYQYVGHSK